MKPIAIFALTAFLALPHNAGAWSDDGHQLVAQVAYDRLPPAKQQKLDAIIGSLNTGHLPYNPVSAACWPDDIKFSRPATRPCHFIDLPVPAGAVPPAPHIVSAIAAQIQQFQAAKAGPDNAANRKKKAEAIAFLIHFVGDIHQPLHCAEHSHDVGGNSVAIANAASGTNLHHFWDGAYSVHMAATGGHVVVPGNGPRPGTAADAAFRQRAQGIVQQFPPGPAWNHLGQDYMAWALESHDKAASIVYGQLQPNGVNSNPATLTPAYVTGAKALAGKRIALAGYRLAALLDTLL